ncbi:hypothetical protein [Amycolatopsis sp. cg13]|uniref:hypothetical protein n=1 Tax=Amycolatopsis sp. cg13 TaxID=3238807 RepID=UPI0035256066
MITMQPVVEVNARDGFGLWPVAEFEPGSYLALGGGLTAREVGTVLMCIASCNDVDPGDNGRPPRPADELGSFLHGLLTVDTLFASGGLRVTDTASGALLPGCCSGLEDWREWNRVLEIGGQAWFGHDPTPCAERRGDLVRLTVDAERSDSPVIELPAAALQRLLAAVENDLVVFLALATEWAARNLPGCASSVIAALARVLDIESCSFRSEGPPCSRKEQPVSSRPVHPPRASNHSWRDG